MKTFLLAAVMALPAVVQGNVIYDFVGIPYDLSPPHSFQLVVSDFLKPDPNGRIFYSCTQFVSASNCGLGVFFSFQKSIDLIQVDAPNNNGYGYRFEPGAFSNIGAFHSLGFGDPNSDNGFLTVRVQASPGPGSDLPEPASVLLVSMSLIVGGALRSSSRKIKI